MTIKRSFILLLREGLLLHQFMVDSPFCQQFLVIANLCHLAILEDIDDICILNGTQPIIVYC